MGIIGWILIGLIMGAIARAILPGKAAGGWFITLVVGVLGALLGGWIGGALFKRPGQRILLLTDHVVLGTRRLAPRARHLGSNRT